MCISPDLGWLTEKSCEDFKSGSAARAAVQVRLISSRECIMRRRFCKMVIRPPLLFQYPVTMKQVSGRVLPHLRHVADFLARLPRVALQLSCLLWRLPGRESQNSALGKQRRDPSSGRVGAGT